MKKTAVLLVAIAAGILSASITQVAYAQDVSMDDIIIDAKYATVPLNGDTIDDLVKQVAGIQGTASYDAWAPEKWQMPDGKKMGAHIWLVQVEIHLVPSKQYADIEILVNDSTQATEVWRVYLDGKYQDEDIIDAVASLIIWGEEHQVQ